MLSPENQEWDLKILLWCQLSPLIPINTLIHVIQMPTQTKQKHNNSIAVSHSSTNTYICIVDVQMIMFIANSADPNQLYHMFSECIVYIQMNGHNKFC